MDLGYLVQVLVRPGMAGHLMLTKDHTLNERSPWDVGAVYLAFAVIVSGDEESDFGAIFIQKIKKVTGVLVGSVIVG